MPEILKSFCERWQNASETIASSLDSKGPELRAEVEASTRQLIERLLRAAVCSGTPEEQAQTVAAFQPMFALLAAPADDVITASVCVAALFKALTEVDEETATRIVGVLLLTAALLGQCIMAVQSEDTVSVPDGPVN